jgi:OmpA-OmpF porin, OOP family
VRGSHVVVPAMVRPNRLRSASCSRAAAAALIAAGAFGVASRAGAQDAPSLNLRGFSPAPDPRATLFLEPVATPGAGVFHAGAWFSYAYRPIVLRDANDEIVGKALEHQIVYDQTLGIGIGSRLGVGLSLPVVLFQQSESNDAVRALYGGRLPPP